MGSKFVYDPYKENLFKNAAPEKFEFARDLKNNLTEAEAKLWAELRDRKLSNAKFRRQHAIASFVADFYCHELKLVVEVDAGIHQTKENKEYDQLRTEELKALGISVIRFTNEDVETNMPQVLNEINSNLIRLRHLLH